MRRIGIIVGIVLVSVAAYTVAIAGSTTSETAGVVRVEKTVVGGWHFGCHSGPCDLGPSPFDPISVTSPTSQATVDLVVSVAMDYQTTPGDFADIRFRYRRAGSPAVNMRPGTFTLDSSGRLTSTALSWIAKGIPAAGAVYDFRLLAVPREASADAHFHIRGRHFTVIIEMWSAG